MNRQEILAALREKRLTPEEARRLLRGEAVASPAPAPVATPAPAPVAEKTPARKKAPAPEKKEGNVQPSPIAIVGMSGRYASAEDLEQYWRLLDEGRDAVRQIPPSRWPMEKYYDPTVGKERSIYCQWMGLLDDIDCFDSFFFEISPSEAEMMDPQHRICLEEAYRAFEDAGYPRQRLDGSNCGVYLGLTSSDYYTLCHRTLERRQGDDLPSVTSVSNAIAAGRLAYYLNLKGPALTVDTACSSSLVSVHLGVQALQRGEVDMALAGGVSLYLSPESYMHMCAAGMLSPDGRCKSFDNGADGFVPGEGAGAVVLKRLADAERDGDQIHGVITASGINQDGRTNGITAPNLGSQIELVRAVYERHGIDPETIGYAELHGTGTKLGDPIELEALATAFRNWTDRRNFCAMGSVKSNIGHMSAAAGVAGLHKILLSLRHRRLVPTLHVRSPNEHFDFESSPFLLSTESREWQPSPGAPRRACLSSFGFSGTNAHVVVDEYVPVAARRPRPRSGGDRERTFVLSAKAEPRLREYAGRLAAHLTAHPEADLDDVAYTLQTGREAMRERLAITARDRERLIDALDRFARLGEIGPDVRRGRATGRSADGGWAEGASVDWSREWEALSPRRIPLPTYPFEKKRHWYPQPVTDDTTEGAEEPMGSGGAALHPLVHENVSDFTRQRFRSAFTGREFFLADHRVGGHPVLPGAAVVEMARAAGELSAHQPVTRISEVVWSRPVTDPTVEIALFPAADSDADSDADFTAGFEVRDGNGTACAEGKLGFGPATRPPSLDIAAIRDRCEARLDHAVLYPDTPSHQDSGVRYGPAFQTLRDLSYSPTEALATLRLDSERSGFVLHPALLDGAWQAIRPLLGSEGRVHLPFAVDSIRCFAPLPSPAYAHIRPAGADAPGSRSFDVTITDAHGTVAAEIAGFTVRPMGRPERAEPVFLTQRWDEVPARHHGDDAGRARTLVLFADEEPDADIAADIAADIQVGAGTGFTVDETGTRFTLRPAEPDDYALLLDELRRRDRLPDRIVLVGAEPGDGPHAVHALAHALAVGGPRWPVDLLYVYPVTDQEPRPEHRAMGGYLRCLAKEDRFVTARTVGVTAGSDVAGLLRREFAADPAEAPDIWWDGGTRRELRTAEAAASAVGEPPFRKGGVYLITGGLGGLGLVFARYLSREYEARLVLAGRREPNGTPLPGRETLYVRADVSRRRDVDALVARAKERFGRIDGVIHSAGTLRDALIRNKSAEDMAAVLGPKVAGTRHLDEALRDEPLDVFVLFSSMSAVLGNVGQSDYCFANAYQDAFAGARERQRRDGRRSGRTLSIGWPFWTDGGMTIQPDAARRLREQLGIAPLAAEEGCRALERALRLPEPHVVYAGGDAAAIRRTFGIERPAPAKAPATPSGSAPSESVRNEYRSGESASSAGLKEQMGAYLTRIISERTKSDADKIDPTDDFELFGIDSIIMMSLTRRMEEDFGELPKTLFFEYANIDELAAYFVANRAEDLRRLFRISEENQEGPASPVKSAERGTESGTESTSSPESAAPRFREGAGPGKEAPRPTPAAPATHDIAIIGISGRYPDADDLPQFWDNLAAGTDAIREVPEDRWDHTRHFAPGGRTPGKAYAKWGGFLRGVDRFDPLFFSISPSEADFLDPQARLFLQTAWHAVEDAGYTRVGLADQTVGVYVGVMYGMYELFQGEIRGEPVPVPSSFASIANRVSYFMNLRGPSMAVDTMCSSSTTTIHLGCESIRRGESDVVIAGGVNLTIHPNKLILLSQGNFASTDGRCRSFGEGGDGYVPGEGVGAVVLKSLDRALADGDHIHAVIKGSAINAGGKTSGFTVPNPNAQAELIRAGLADAGVDARTISYIEAHGTGTTLGDPIEVTALTNAFRAHTPDTGFCAIGSVKSNIGHLESAAGIAALTKVVLQLKHRQLVPSLHSTTLNPYIDFAHSPFVVQREPAPWVSPGGHPRRAGISSFGAGGANAHLVVEEFVEESVEERAQPAPRPRPAGAGPQLFVFSARDEDRLRELVARNLAAARNAYDDADLASVAYTLQVGREAMERRLAVVADGLGELTSLLEAYLAGDTDSARFFTGDGRGAKQQSKLLVGLIEDSDMTSRLLRERRLDKTAELWVEGIAMDWPLLYGDRPPRRVPLPGYPFAQERCWVTGPAETRSAAVTGADRLHPLLHRNSSTLEGLRFSATFTGREFFLDDHRVGGKKLLPAVACLEMALAAVRAALPERARGEGLLVRDVVWTRPFTVDEDERTVHVTLTPADGADVVDFRIHAEHVHCQGAVQLTGAAAPPAATLDLAAVRARCTRPRVEGSWCYEAFARMGIDYGPAHQAVETVYRGSDEALVALRLPAAVSADADRYTLHPSLLDAALQATLALALPEDPAALPEAAGASAELPFAVRGVEVTGAMAPVMWAHLRPARTVTGGDRLKKIDITLCDDSGRVAVRLDQVAFKTYSYDAAEEDAAADDGGVPERLLFAPRWRERAPGAGSEGAAHLDRWVVLVCDPAEGLLAELARLLPGADCRAVSSDAARPQDRYQVLAVDLLRQTRQLLQESRGQRLLVQVVASDPASDGLVGFLRTLRGEHPAVCAQLVRCQDGPRPAVLAERLRAERAWPADQVVRYAAGGRREVREWAELPAPADGGGPLWRDGGVYLVTGGAGGLGLLMADEIAQSVRRPRLVLTGRSAPGARTAEALERLRALGAVAEYAQADVTDAMACRELIARIGSEHSGPDGILHCAGVTRDRMLTGKTAEDARAVLAPKSAGLVALDEATAHLPLEFFLLFSSVAGALGNVGQADYAAGNAFMDHYAAHREELVARGERHGRTLSVNWQLWQDGGMGLSAERTRAAADTAGLAVLDRATGLGALAACVASGESQVLPLVGDPAKLRAYLRAQTGNTPVRAPERAVASRPDESEREQEPTDRAELLAAVLKDVIAEEIRLDAGRVDAHVPLENYGIDSVVIINLTQQLERSFGPLPKTIFFENQTVMELARALCRSHPQQVAELVGPRTAAPAQAAPAMPESDPALPPAGWSPLWTRGGASGASGTPAVPEATGSLDIAIVGLAGRYPQAEDMAAFWANLRRGRDCVTEIPDDRWDHALYHSPEPGRQDRTYARWGGFIEDAVCFDSLFFNISPGEAEVMDPQERIFLECVHHTLEDAGYSRRSLAGRDVGVYVGVMYEEYQLYAAQRQLRGEMITLNGSAASIANRVSYHYGLHGPSLAVDTMCSSSLVAIHLAAQSLRAGECEAAIAGGVNLSLHPSKFLMLGKNHFASTRGRCESFGSGGDGYVPGEGVGAVLLKPLARAEADGDHIYGVIKGTAVSHDGKTNGYTVPNPHAQTAVIRRALERAGVDPRDVSYVEAHGTGTRLGDPIEVSALTKVFGTDAARARRCYLGSAKSNIGHCESAAGIAGVSKVLLQLRHREIAPSLHSAEPNPEIDFAATPFTVPQEVTPWEAPPGRPRVAGISGFGAGGTNAHVVIAEYRGPARPNAVGAGGPVPVMLSARREEQLRGVAERLLDGLRGRRLTAAELADVAYTLQVGRDAFEERLGFVVDSQDGLETGLADFLAGRQMRYRGHVPTPVPPPRGRAAQEVRARYAAGEYGGLLDLWVGGQDLDWEALAPPGTRIRVSLPAYPFARQRHWMPSRDAATPLTSPGTAPTAPRIHPLLHQNRSSLFEQRFTATFTGREPFLDGHRVGGEKVLPGSVSLEMARLAGALSLEQDVWSVRDVLWRHPVEVGEEPVEVTVRLFPEGDSVRVHVGLDEGPGDARVCMEAWIDLAAGPAEPSGGARPLDLSGIIADCDRKLSGAVGYAAMAAVGLDNGPEFQVIEEVLFRDGEAVVHLALPPSADRDGADVLHPALVNGAFQAVVALMGDPDGAAGHHRLFLPFSIAGVDIRGPLPEECVAHLRRTGDPGSGRTAIDRFDITLTDLAGNALVVVKDYALKSFWTGAENR
ncbi:SDR family NAD(P)-dependent oxidoreductase [Streptomyces sp. LZ34]